MLHRHNGESWSFKESLIPNMRGNGELSFQTPPLERGKYVFSETECASEDIFGLIEHRGKFKAKGEFRVLPRTVFIPYWQLYDRKSRLSGPQTALTRSRRETTQINGVRDYVYGDDSPAFTGMQRQRQGTGSPRSLNMSLRPKPFWFWMRWHQVMNMGMHLKLPFPRLLSAGVWCQGTNGDGIVDIVRTDILHGPQ